MPVSITRKFLAKQLPDLAGKNKNTYERFYLYNQNSIVIRIQKVNDTYELEHKANESEDQAHSFIPLDWFGKEITGTPLAQDGHLLKLSKEEFAKLII